jgi:hypothetical protein
VDRQIRRSLFCADQSTPVNSGFFALMKIRDAFQIKNLAGERFSEIRFLGIFFGRCFVAMPRPYCRLLYPREPLTVQFPGGNLIAS